MTNHVVKSTLFELIILHLVLKCEVTSEHF